MNLAVVGSRNTPDTYLRYILNVVEKHNPTRIISGGAIGVDTYAIDVAKILGIPYTIHKPDKKYPIPERYYIRNELIVKDSDSVVAFYYKKRTPGTSHTVWVARKMQKPVQEIMLV